MSFFTIQIFASKMKFHKIDLQVFRHAMINLQLFCVLSFILCLSCDIKQHISLMNVKYAEDLIISKPNLVFHHRTETIYFSSCLFICQ